MKWIKKSLITLLLLLILSGTGGYFYFKIKFQPPPNQLSTPPGTYAIPFVWENDSSNRYAALLIPVKIPGCDQLFYLQFDTGAPYSIFYKNKLKAIHERFSIPWNENDGHLQDYKFKIEGLNVEARSIKLIKHGSKQINWHNSHAKTIIGTAGTDLLENKVIVIDYQKQYMLLTNSMPSHLSAGHINFNALSFTGRRVMLPASINGKKTTLLFDTGSSAFELLTSEGKWSELRTPGGSIRSFPVKSWSKTLTAHQAGSSSFLQFGTDKIALNTVTYIDGVSPFQSVLMSLSGMGGMIGNKLFLNHTIILDLQSNRFGVL